MPTYNTITLTALNVGRSRASAGIRYSGPRSRHLGQHPPDVLLDPPDLALDLLQRARRRVAVEVAIEVDLVADKADLPVFGVALGCVDPGVGNVGPDFTFEEGFDALREWHALRIT